MRAVVLAFVALVVLAAPAAAQLRDPFDPAIDPDAATTTTTTGTTTDAGQPVTQPAATTDTLSNTGADLQGWIVVAFGIMAVGAAALYLFRLYTQPLSK